MNALRFMAALVALSPCAAGASNFPVPRAELGFASAMRWAQSYIPTLGGNAQKFEMAAQPYGPLSLDIQKSDNGKEADMLKNYFAGVTGSMVGQNTGRLSNAFHCGPPCAYARRDKAIAVLPALTKLVKAFQAIPQLTVVAQWGAQDELRVNNAFQLSTNMVLEMMPSAPLGLIPSNELKPWPSMHAYVQSTGANASQVESIAQALRKIGWAAVARVPGGVKVILMGIADNEAGVIFYDQKPPVAGDATTDGLEYVGVENIAPHVAFYETT